MAMHEQMYMCMSMDMYVDKSVGTDMYMISCVQVHVHVTGQGPVHAYGDYHVCVRACLQICIHVLVCARAGEINGLWQGEAQSSSEASP